MASFCATPASAPPCTHTHSNIFPPDDRVHNLLPAGPESSTTLLQSCEATNAASCDKRHLTWQLTRWREDNDNTTVMMFIWEDLSRQTLQTASHKAEQTYWNTTRKQTITGHFLSLPNNVDDWASDSVTSQPPSCFFDGADMTRQACSHEMESGCKKLSNYST